MLLTIIADGQRLLVFDHVDIVEAWMLEVMAGARSYHTYLL